MSFFKEMSHFLISFIILTEPIFSIEQIFCTCENLNLNSGVLNTSNNFDVLGTESEITCDPLQAEGTAVLCFSPAKPPKIGFEENATDCSESSPPGTVASYTCTNFRGVTYSGFLNCASSGLWIISFTFANNSLCNLDSALVNFEVPDVVIATDEPEFTTPLPNAELIAPDFKDYEKAAIQVHNIFRKNHGMPPITLSRQLSTMAQTIVDSIPTGEDLRDVESHLKLSPTHHTMNIEMNWYFQVLPSPNPIESVSNAIQSWYAGFGQYDWNQPEKSLENGNALAFTRIIWKSTQLLGVGVGGLKDNFTFVVCVYTPARNIESIDPVNEFNKNVLPFKIG